MREEDLKTRFSIVYLILCLDGIEKKLVFDKCAIFFLDKDDFVDPSEVGEDVVDTVMIILDRKRANKKNLRRTVFQHKLL